MTDFIEKLLDPRPKPRPKLEKPRRWKNKWRALEPPPPHNLRPMFLGDMRVQPGHIHWSRLSWPSKDIALDKAHQAIKNDLAEHGFQTSEHLGAFEVDE